MVVELIVIANVPFTLPLKSPLRVKFPVSLVCPSTRQEPVEVNLKFVTLTAPPPLWFRDVVKV